MAWAEVNCSIKAGSGLFMVYDRSGSKGRCKRQYLASFYLTLIQTEVCIGVFFNQFHRLTALLRLIFGDAVLKKNKQCG